MGTASAALSLLALAVIAPAARADSCTGKSSGGVPFAGGRAIETPFGTVYSSNLTRDEATGEQPPAYLKKAFARLRSFEGQELNGQSRPPAYVFVTNTPWDLYLDAPAPRCTRRQGRSMETLRR